MTEIVALKVRTIVTNDPQIIRALLKTNAEVELLSRERMQLMSYFDLGKKWDNLARGRTLFEIDESGNLHD